jgi:outer membrane protein
VLALALCLLTGAAQGQTYDPEIQRSFVEGARQFETGDLENAERTFRALARKTDSPRVKLELARTLFALKRYSESRLLFNQVLLDPDVPWGVRDNIEAFLRQIDEAEGYARFAVSLVSDSNPRNISSQREFTIGGFRLTFVPPADNKRVTGLRYAVQAMQPIDRGGRLSAYFAGSYVDYPNIIFDRLTADFGLVKGIDQAGRASVRAGMEGGTFGGRELYQFPYVGLAFLLTQSALHRVTAQARVGRVNFPNFGSLDARYHAMALSAVRSVDDALALALNLTLERSDAAERAFSYTDVSIGPGISWLIAAPALLAKLDLSYGERDYADADPFFGGMRSDCRARMDLAVRSKHWRLFNFTPALIVSLERNRSSLDFYSYKKVSASIALE